MYANFESLPTPDQQILMDAIPMIAILVAGADGEIEETEIKSAEKLTHIRTYNSPEFLQPFYEKVDVNMESKIKALLKTLPKKVEARNAVLSTKLAKLNSVLPTLEPEYRKSLYDSLRSYAKHIARAEGGIFGVFAINTYENKMMKLPMVDEVLAPEE